MRPLAGTVYEVEVTATAGWRAVSLGRATVANRRLALRWLRRQAHRLADGPGAPGIPGVRAIGFEGPAVPDGLRAWARDPDQQEQAMARLEVGGSDVLTVLDPAAGLLVTLAGRPLRSGRAAADRPLHGTRHLWRMAALEW
ncbi:hypothetical protein [Streptomyces laculatispora]|uniref:hypothetical protein n=1 Tax=Streptomyces laculatispora TaxID=887464 RepID=UPI001A94EC9B|nr:hypothetical protein [Streptomyces laculatispora]MBO0916607.1 hypothetical protein [Streptomyces laculatispora]